MFPIFSLFFIYDEDEDENFPSITHPLISPLSSPPCTRRRHHPPLFLSLSHSCSPPASPTHVAAAVALQRRRGSGVATAAVALQLRLRKRMAVVWMSAVGLL
ncbi:hypothetical protein Hanom_Chr16g01481341 [Helianthus anomalus]